MICLLSKQRKRRVRLVRRSQTSTNARGLFIFRLGPATNFCCANRGLTDVQVPRRSIPPDIQPPPVIRLSAGRGCSVSRAGVAVFPHDPIVRFAGREIRAATSDTHILIIIIGDLRMLSLSLENRENAVPQLTDVMCSDTTGRTREPTQQEPLVYAKVRHQLSSFTTIFPSASKEDCQHLYHSSLCVCHMCRYIMYVKPAPMRNTH